MVIQVNKTVRVAVIFAPGEAPRPIWFDWNRRKYQIAEITYRWQEQRGATTLHHYATAVDSNLYELIYDSNEQSWMLGAVDTEQR
ncbi:MAG: hypothetical protein P1P74_07590 [Desulfuromonadales bacterium]|nr:hypothetical protein [Desulfuromonadales bacterium]MDT8422959.1 hypothetical protein [Desulfuromonadales bacterium]